LKNIKKKTVGQQQLLLIVLGIVVIGIAIALAMSLFRSNAIENKRDILSHECINLGSNAMGYYRKPESFGGGGRKFTGWNMPENLKVSANGYFTAEVLENSVIITGTGNEVITGTDSIKVQVTVYPDNYILNIIN
jgi:hypothetical protein